MINTGALPQPQGLQFVQWGAIVAEQLAEFGILAPLEEKSWQDWACSLLYVPELAVFPSPHEFSSWTEWATRVLETNL